MRAALAGFVVALLACPAVGIAADPPITADQARERIGKRVTVCGDVVAVGHALAKGQGGKQTFLHFDQAPPNTAFTAVIIGNDLAGGGVFFGIDRKVEHKNVCVTGYVKRFGSGEGTMMVVDAPNQLKIMGDARLAGGAPARVP